MTSPGKSLVVFWWQWPPCCPQLLWAAILWDHRGTGDQKARDRGSHHSCWTGSSAMGVTIHQYFHLRIWLSQNTCYGFLDHFHIWKASLQLCCSDTCQIWMWHSMHKHCFGNGEKPRENSRNEFSNPHPNIWYATGWPWGLTQGSQDLLYFILKYIVMLDIFWKT